MKGVVIDTADPVMHAPRDYLLIARVVKRNCRPLTVAEVKHEEREHMIFGLNQQIKEKQKHGQYERNVTNQ